MPLLRKRADQVEARALLPMVLLCLQRVDRAVMSAAETRAALVTMTAFACVCMQSGVCYYVIMGSKARWLDVFF